MLLFFTWLATLFLQLPFLQNKPMLFLALLPGIGIALYIPLILYRNLHLNYSDTTSKLLFSTIGMANWITLWRAAAIVALAGFLPLPLMQKELPAPALGWLSGGLYLFIALTDLLDGFAARKTKRVTELGKRLDIETDAAGLVAASVVAIALGRLPEIYILVGMAYYLFSLGIWLRRKRDKPVRVLQQRPYSRIIAGFQMGLVAVALLPLFRPTFTHLAAIIFMTPLLVGFLRDWLVVSCRMQTDRNQTTIVDTISESLFIRTLPLMLRLIILSTGVYTAVNYLNLAYLPWVAALSMLCLLAVLGFMSRCSCLLIILVLANHQSPFAANAITTITFVCAALVMLIGPGAFYLWAPEEAVLYRRFPTKSDTSELSP
jgi:CDP-diacylglycerol--glycerol-3-phosphate 3-phosphatidyltransferase